MDRGSHPGGIESWGGGAPSEGLLDFVGGEGSHAGWVESGWGGTRERGHGRRIISVCFQALGDVKPK